MPPFPPTRGGGGTLFSKRSNKYGNRATFSELRATRPRSSLVHKKGRTQMGKMHNDAGEIQKLTIRSSPTVVAPLIALLLLLLPPQLFGQVLRDPATPYHFLRYEEVPVDQQNPAWTHDFWAPIKFIPLTIAPGSYLNFGGELRERVEHFSHQFFGLTD